MGRTIEIRRNGATAKDNPCCFNRLHWSLPPVATARAGDYIIYETRDAFDDQFSFSTTAADVAVCDLTRVHPMTGPVFIEGAEQGDALAVTVVDIAPNDYGYTVTVPGFGFLRDVIPGPFVINWKLDRLAAMSEQLPNIRFPDVRFPRIYRRIAWKG
jgi:formamidase